MRLLREGRAFRRAVLRRYERTFVRVPLSVERDMQRPLVDALKKAADEQHQQARTLTGYINSPPTDGELNESQKGTLAFAARQRRLGDALHDLATQIQRG